VLHGRAKQGKVNPMPELLTQAWQEELAAFELGQLSDDEAVGIESHLEQCDSCRQLLGILSAVAYDYVVQAAQGLQHAYESGRVHREIEPQNLMVKPADQVKSFDFGLAGLTPVAIHESSVAASADAEPQVARLTALGTVMGIPTSPPKQVADSARADIRADIDSLGRTHYFLLTGQLPFTGGSIAEKVRAHAEHGARCVRLLRDRLSCSTSPRAVIERHPIRRLKSCFSEVFSVR
jgi:serine/threonine protein kinase